MRTTPYRDTSPLLIFDTLTPLNQLSQITKPRRSIRIRKNNILPTRMSHPVRHSPTLSSILF